MDDTNNINQGSTVVRSIVVSVALATVIHALVLSRGFYSATIDESGRTLDAYQWIQGNEPLATVWLPFYKVIVGYALKLSPDLFVTPRIVSFAFSVMSICSLIWLSHLLFHHGLTTLLAGILGAVFPPRAVLGIVPLAEIMFIATITLAMGFLILWHSTKRTYCVLCTAGMFAVASSIRYEGWIFAGLFCGYLTFVYLNRVAELRITFIGAVGSVFICLSFMALWIVIHFIETGEPLGFVAGTSGRYARIHGDSLDFLLRNNPLVQFVLQNVWTLNILGFLSVRQSMRMHMRGRSIVLIAVMALLVVSGIALFGKGMPTHGFWRVPAVWSILLVPFTAQWFGSRLSSFHHPRSFQRVALVALLVGVLMACIWRIHSMTEHSAFSKDDLAAGKYINEELSFRRTGGAHKVLIESGIWSYINVIVASQHPESFVYNTGFDPVRHEEPLLNPETPFDKSQFLEKGIDIFVFRREDYREYLETNMHVQKLADAGPWTIYALL